MRSKRIIKKKGNQSNDEYAKSYDYTIPTPKSRRSTTRATPSKLSKKPRRSSTTTSTDDVVAPAKQTTDTAGSLTISVQDKSTGNKESEITATDNATLTDEVSPVDAVGTQPSLQFKSHSLHKGGQGAFIAVQHMMKPPPTSLTVSPTKSPPKANTVTNPYVTKATPQATATRPHPVRNPYLKPKQSLELQSLTQSMLDDVNEEDEYNSNELLAASTLGALSQFDPDSLLKPGSDLMFGAAEGLAKFNQEMNDKSPSDSTLTPTVHELGRNSWEHMPTEKKRSIAAKQGLNIGCYEEMKDVANALLESEASSFVTATTQPPPTDTTNANPPPPPTDSTNNTNTLSERYDTELANFCAEEFAGGVLSTEDELKQANALFKKKEFDIDGGRYAGATTYSSHHERVRQKLYEDLVRTINDNKDCFKSLADMEEGVNGQQHPKLFNSLSGKVTLAKAECCSTLLWKYSLGLTNSRAVQGGCPYLQPSSHMSNIRNILGMMRRDFGWEFSLEKDFKFTGGFEGRIKQLFEERSKEYPQVRYTFPFQR